MISWLTIAFCRYFLFVDCAFGARYTQENNFRANDFDCEKFCAAQMDRFQSTIYCELSHSFTPQSTSGKRDSCELEKGDSLLDEAEMAAYISKMNKNKYLSVDNVGILLY